MLDHVVLATVSAIGASLQDALLERHPADERLSVDLLGGDVTFEVSCNLPGDGQPPRVRADLVVEWAAWSQASYLAWRTEDVLEDPPEMDIELVLRVQRLRGHPPVAAVLAALPRSGPDVELGPLERSGPTVEQALSDSNETTEWAMEVSYEGAWTFNQQNLEDLAGLAERLRPLGPWIASTLVRLGDLSLPFLPYPGEGRPR